MNMSPITVEEAREILAAHKAKVLSERYLLQDKFRKMAVDAKADGKTVVYLGKDEYLDLCKAQRSTYDGLGFRHQGLLKAGYPNHEVECVKFVLDTGYGDEGRKKIEKIANKTELMFPDL